MVIELNQLLMVIGLQQVELIALREQVEAMEKRLAEVDRQEATRHESDR
jgi:hypothetical protein